MVKRMSPYEIRQGFLLTILCSLAVLVIITMIRVILGPRISDRIVAVNMISTQTIVMVAVLTVYLEEVGLADISILYAMLSFLAVVILTKIYIGVYRERQKNTLRKIVKDHTTPVEKED
ncbi:MAG: sodium:proton antiporter [Oscillospiraceae bacterium]|nr:sodium:proton antiporter [Oscillospiraceae bacterium]